VITSNTRKLIVGVGLIVFFSASALWLTQSNANADNCASGSFTRSCNEIKCVGEEVHAKCKNISGSRVSTSLNNYASCDTDIANCNGQLRCTCGADCPSGSYSRSCMCCAVYEKYNPQKEQSEKHLACLCKNKKGKYIDTTLTDYLSCKQNDQSVYTIWNDNGSLKCDK
jgi:hypothetical protein